MNKKDFLSEQSLYTIEGFTTINDLSSLSWTFLHDLSRSFNGKGFYKEVLKNLIDFSGKKFYLYGDDVFMFEYNSMEDLKKDSENWDKRFKMKNAITSETIDGKQVLKSSGYFEYNGKYYLLGFLYQDLNESDNNENNGVYKGVIVNPEKYFEVENNAKGIRNSVNETIKK